MHFAFTEEQEELRAQARAFLAEHASSEAVRRAMASEAGYEPEVWKRLGGELGWTGVAIPEELGGAGLGMVELVALLEPMGEALLAAPFFASLCLAAPALLGAPDGAAARTWLPAIAEGRTIATLAPGAAADRSGPGADAVRWRREGGGFVLAGRAGFVLDGAAAELVIVAAESATAGGPRALFALPAATPGVERRALATMDQTRRFAALELRDVRVPAAALVGAEDEGAALLARALDLAAVALAAEQTGGAQRCLDLAVAYAKERVQFGRPIGSFQAIKHKCADLMVQVETARSAAYYAGCAAAEGHDDLARTASLAKAWCSEAYFRCAADALQVHGGVGFTWEYDVHLHLKRARSMEAWLGTPAWHRERIAGAIGLGAPA
ncbi:MAG: acyl-CoA/acyl-ACP dehydrogenase [Deltaproteobacteria bacterium]|nr:acyl-CoA/acyl-ACP dehydrogenase [Deltaproteobacteria bacterium]